MWHFLTTLPLIAKIASLVGVAGLGIWGWLKKSAIGALGRDFNKRAGDWFWGYFRKKLKAGSPQVDLRMVVGIPARCEWYIGAVGPTPVLAIELPMNFAHNESGLSLHIIRAYLEGTEEAAPSFPIIVDGPYCPEQRVHMMLTPIIAKPGKNLSKRAVFVDQFNKKHVTDYVSFVPHRTPPESRGAGPFSCFFCHHAIQPDDIAAESYPMAHTKCIWK
jgi:hypothetical protein